MNQKDQFHKDLNSSITDVMCLVTAGMRYKIDGYPIQSLDNLREYTLPFPRVGYVIPTWTSTNDPTTICNNVSKTSNSLLNLDDCQSNLTKIVTLLNGSGFNDESAKQAVNQDSWLNLPNATKEVTTGICLNEPTKLYGTSLINTANIKNYFVKSKKSFYSMYKSRAYIHW